MTKVVDGFHYAKDNEVLNVVVVDGDVRLELFSPSPQDLVNLCNEFGFPVDYTIDLIRQYNRAYMILFDAPEYREHVKEVFVKDQLTNRIAQLLDDHRPDVTSYDAWDIHGCECGKLALSRRMDPDACWLAYRRHVADKILKLQSIVKGEDND